MRFLLIDRITRWEPGKRASAVKSIALSEDFFEDHFPSQPIMPGVLLLEGMAQLAGLLLEEGVRRSTGERPKALMSIVEKAKFRKPARPGDLLQYDAEVLSVNEAGGKVVARANRGDDLVAECTLVFTFHEYGSPRADALRAETLALWLKDLPTDAAR